MQTDKNQNGNQQKNSFGTQQNFLQQCTPTNNQQGYQHFGFNNQQFMQQYCWNHGICGHCSGDCTRPAPGHQRNATILNRMKGNNYDYGRS